MLQTAVNGSEYILGCALDKDQTQLLSAEWISTSELREDLSEHFIFQGKHVRFMLAECMKFLEHVSDQDVWKLSFDDGKRPLFEKASGDVEVLPKHC